MPISVFAHDVVLKFAEIDDVDMPKSKGSMTQKSLLSKSFYNAKIENSV